MRTILCTANALLISWWISLRSEMNTSNLFLWRTLALHLYAKKFDERWKWNQSSQIFLVLFSFYRWFWAIWWRDFDTKFLNLDFEVRCSHYLVFFFRFNNMDCINIWYTIHFIRKKEIWFRKFNRDTSDLLLWVQWIVIKKLDIFEFIFQILRAYRFVIFLACK